MYNKEGGIKSMEYQYTINDIKAAVKVSLQSLYALIKKNQAFINENSIRKQRKIYYNQAAMDFFISYYSPDTEKKIPDEIIDTETGGGKAENPLEKTSYREEEQQARIDALQVEIKTLHEEIDTLKAQLAAKENERVELLRQNGALILTIQQQQQEKMLLLPSPKRSLGERVKSFFTTKPQEK